MKVVDSAATKMKESSNMFLLHVQFWYEIATIIKHEILDDIFLAYEQLLGNKFFFSTGRGLQLPLSHCKFKVFRPCSSHPVGLDFDDAFGS